MVSIICWIKHVIESRPYLKIYLLPIDCTHWLRVVWWLGDGWDWGWCGRCDGWSKEQKIRICQGKIKKQQVKQVNKAIPHPHIASSPRLLSIKDARGNGRGEGGRWTFNVAIRPSWCWHECKRWWVVFIHKKINWYLLTLLLLHIVVKGTTKMCVQIVRQIANCRG